METINNTIPVLKPSIKFKNIDTDKAIIYDEIKSVYYKTSNSITDILQLINGKNNINDINEKYKKQSGIVLTNEQLTNIIYNKIGQKFIVVEYENTDKNITNNSIYINNKILIFNAKTTNFIAQKLKYFYSFIFFIPFFILLIYCIYSLTNMPTTIAFINNTTFILYPILIISSIIIHEFGHAVACSSYSIKNKGIGVGLFMGFMPVAFADVSAIWLLQPRQRIVVNLGGVYFETIFLVVIFLIAKVFKIQILLPLYLLIYLKTLTNLIPFYRSDGYWIISDLFEIENLYSTSINVTKKIILDFKNTTKKDIGLSLYFIANILLLLNFIYYVLFNKGIVVLISNTTQFFQTLTKHKQFNSNLIGSVFVFFMFCMLCYRITKIIVQQINKRYATK